MSRPTKRAHTPVQFQRTLAKRLLKYKTLNPLEHDAMFMGVVQLLELNLKGVLQDRYGVDYDQMERWTLGRVLRTLKAKGVRKDLCAVLDDILEYRNYVAHEFLANEVLLGPFQKKGHPTRGTRKLQRWTIELEQIILLCEQIEEHNNWEWSPTSDSGV